jgi:hypothetical protein
MNHLAVMSDEQNRAGHLVIVYRTLDHGIDDSESRIILLGRDRRRLRSDHEASRRERRDFPKRNCQ